MKKAGDRPHNAYEIGQIQMDCIILWPEILQMRFEPRSFINEVRRFNHCASQIFAQIIFLF
jgi:hypothetical protein